ncbi:hypothetical protein OESDEN_13527, partial [Oesophagostomum dentatum]
MGVILISFAVGIYILVQPYLNSIVVNEDLSTKKMGNEFGSIPHAMRKLYWAVYGYLEPDSYYIVTGNSGPDRTPTVHGFTSFATESDNGYMRKDGTIAAFGMYQASEPQMNHV